MKLPGFDVVVRGKQNLWPLANMEEGAVTLDRSPSQRNTDQATPTHNFRFSGHIWDIED